MQEVRGSTPRVSTIFIKESVMKRCIEIRAAEGGEDSRLFVQDLAQAYLRLADRVG